MKRTRPHTQPLKILASEFDEINFDFALPHMNKFKSILSSVPPRMLSFTSFELLLGGWISAISDANQYLQIDFLVVMEVNKVQIKGNADLNAFVKKFKLAESKDGVTWITVKTGTGADKVRHSLFMER